MVADELGQLMGTQQEEARTLLIPQVQVQVLTFPPSSSSSTFSGSEQTTQVESCPNHPLHLPCYLEALRLTGTINFKMAPPSQHNWLLEIDTSNTTI